MVVLTKNPRALQAVQGKRKSKRKSRSSKNPSLTETLLFSMNPTSIVSYTVPKTFGWSSSTHLGAATANHLNLSGTRPQVRLKERSRSPKSTPPKMKTLQEDSKFQAILLLNTSTTVRESQIPRPKPTKAPE